MKLNIVLIVFCLVMAACSGGKKREGNRLRIVATTGMIGDAVRNIVGDSAEVFVLMGPGVDPHLYKPTPRDIDRLSYADVVVYNGLHLEGKMADIMEKIGKRKKAIAIADHLPPSLLIVTSKDEQGGYTVYDPHIWFDVRLWNRGVSDMGRELAAFDSLHREYFLHNLEKYRLKLDSLDRWTNTMISGIPESQRVMITAHDAFHYFGKAYRIEVMGLQGISTVAEPGLKDITQLVSLISSRKIRSVFVESSVSEKSIQSVIQGCRERGHQVSIGGTLFSDAMGASGTPEGTYAGMVRANVKTIVNGLK